VLGKDGRPLEDAPRGHAAWTVLRFDRSNQYYIFMIPRGPSNADDFVVSKSPKFALKPHRCGDNHLEAKRLLRLCYFKFLDGGANRESVKEYMEQLLEESKAADFNGPASDDATVEMETALCKRGSKRKEPDSAREPLPPPKTTAGADSSQPAPAKAKDPTAASGPIDDIVLTEAAMALKLKFKPPGISTGLGVCWFEYVSPTDGSKARFQTTVNSAGGSVEAAERIARLCYAKFESGAKRAEVEAFRTKQYELCGGPVSGNTANSGATSPKRKRSKQGGADRAIQAVMKTLKEDGRLEGAVQIHGREEKKKNSSINGIYALAKGGFQGKLAYEKADSSTKRFIFYSARKGRWKVHESLDDSAGGFAYAKGSGDTQPGPQLRWHIFDGSGKGYNEDAEVRCAPLIETETTKASGGDAAGVASVSGGQGGKEDNETGSGSDSDNDEGSGSGASSAASGSSGSSSSDSGDEAPEGSPPADVSPAGGTAAVEGGPRGRVIAKMLVRSGLRCSCHFAYMWECQKMAL